MAKFKLHEIVINCASENRCHPESLGKYCGEEFEVIKVDVDMSNHDLMMRDVLYYEIHHRDGKILFAAESYLRKLPPHDTVIEWEELKDVYEPKELVRV